MQPAKSNVHKHILLVRPTTQSDPTSLYRRLRRADHLELKALSGMGSKKKLQQSIADPRLDVAYSIVFQKRVLGIFGVTISSHTMTERVGAPWMVGTDELFNRFGVTVARQSKRWLARLSRDYTVLENHIFAQNDLHIRWIEWLGFELVEYKPHHGALRKPFWRFRMETNNVERQARGKKRGVVETQVVCSANPSKTGWNAGKDF